MNSKTVYIHTLGCQMNVYDSDRICIRLLGMGYDRVSSAEAADLVIINTCAIRAKAEQKLYSLVGRLADLKKKKPALRIGIGGCVAQQEGEKLLNRAPCIDFVFGTHAIGRLNDLITQVERSGRRTVDVKLADCPDDDFSYAMNPSISRQISRFVTIMTGCDNYCTYCVVPYVRGAEVSRPPEHILDEIHMLADSGVREMDELEKLEPYGQNNSVPIFITHNVTVQSSRIVGEYHRQLVLGQSTTKGEKLISAIQFNVDPNQPLPRELKRMAYRLRWNYWNGNRTPQIIIEST